MWSVSFFTSEPDDSKEKEFKIIHAASLSTTVYGAFLI